MDWKEENPKKRYIDSITWEEAKHIAYLAAGQPDDFDLIKLDARCNGNNIPHVELQFTYYEYMTGTGEANKIGIFNNLNVYYGERFGSTYCQKEIFKAFEEMGFD